MPGEATCAADLLSKGGASEQEPCIDPRLRSASVGASAERLDIHPSAAYGLDFGESRTDLGQQVRQEQQHRIWLVYGELRWIDDGNVCPGHPQTLLGR
jgi:hypothetical protein